MSRVGKKASKAPALGSNMTLRGAFSSIEERWGRVALAMAAVFAGLCVVSSTSSAVVTHGLEFTIDGTGSTAGPFADLGPVAVYEGNGDLFAADRAQNVINKFDAAGNPKTFSALGTTSLDVTVCPGFTFAGENDAIAVDSSGGSHDGTIYITNPRADQEFYTRETCAFAADGTFLWADPEWGESHTVDKFGNLWMAEYGGVTKFSNTGTGLHLLTSIGNGNYPKEMALDADFNLYLYEYYASAVTRYSPTLEVVGPVTGVNFTKLGMDLGTGHLYLYKENGIADEYSEAGDNQHLIGSFGDDTMGPSEGLVVNGNTGTIYIADAASDEIYVFSGLTNLPAVTTGEMSEGRRTTATVTGTIDPDGSTATDCYVKYGATIGYGATAPCEEPAPYDPSEDVTAELTGLSGSTTYHYRLFAKTESGLINSGKDRTLTTPTVSAVRTEPATDIERDSATLEGSLDPEGISTTYYFQWGPTIGYGNTSPAGPPGSAIGPDPGDTPVEAGIAGLSPESEYHYRLVAINSDGKSVGKDRTLTTSQSVADLKTTDPIDVGPEEATLTATLDPDGLDTSYFFEWGATSSYGQITPLESAGSVAGNRMVTAQVGELEDYAEYHYRVVAENSWGVTIGEDITFLSGPPFLPVVSNTAASDIKITGATLSATINPGFGPTVFRFQYGTSDRFYDSRTEISDPIGEDGSDHDISLAIDNLRPGTQYHYRVVAINFSGSTLGPDQTFFTTNTPRIDSVGATNVGSDRATLTALIGAGGSPTTYHFEFGGDRSYGQRTPESSSIGSGMDDQLVSNYLDGLAANTTYHYRVVVTNENGTVLSGDGVLTTTGRTAEIKPPATKCKPGQVKRHGRCVKRRGKKKRHGRNHRSPSHRGDRHKKDARAY